MILRDDIWCMKKSVYTYNRFERFYAKRNSVKKNKKTHNVSNVSMDNIVICVQNIKKIILMFWRGS